MSYRVKRRVRKKFLQQILRSWGTDINCRRKDRLKSKLVRTRIKRNTSKEVQEYEKGKI